MYKNCVGNVIKIKFDNSVTIYLNKDEKALEKFSRRRILSVAKYDLRVTVAGDKYRWIKAPLVSNHRVKVIHHKSNDHLLMMSRCKPRNYPTKANRVGFELNKNPNV